jgi:hypothetical protein
MPARTSAGETEIGAIHVSPSSGRTARVHGSHLMVNGALLQVSALLTSSDRLNWDFVHHIDTTTGRFTISGNALTALVDGREVATITDVIFNYQVHTEDGLYAYINLERNDYSSCFACQRPTK